MEVIKCHKVLHRGKIVGYYVIIAGKDEYYPRDTALKVLVGRYDFGYRTIQGEGYLTKRSGFLSDISYSDIMGKQGYPRAVNLGRFAKKVQFISASQVREKYRQATHEYKKRDCYVDIVSYLESTTLNKVCALYGMRDTGKSVLLRQAVAQYGGVYIELTQSSRLQDLFEEMDELLKAGVTLFAIDEITDAIDFQECVKYLADYYSNGVIKILCADTNSLLLHEVADAQLYHRVCLVNTTFMSFHEFHRLTGKGLDSYLEMGGKFGDTGSRYSVVDNLYSSLSRLSVDSSLSKALFRGIRVDKTMLNAVVVALMERTQVAGVVKGFYDYIPAKADSWTARVRFDLCGKLRKSQSEKAYKAMHPCVYEQHYFGREELKPFVKGFLSILARLQLLTEVQVFDGVRLLKSYIITQPAVRGDVVRRVIDSLSVLVNEVVTVERRSKQALAYSLEDTVFLHLQQQSPQATVFKFRGEKVLVDGKIPEIDVVIVQGDTLHLVEVKYTESRKMEQCKWLAHPDVLDCITSCFALPKGVKVKRTVVYRGEDAMVSFGGCKVDYVSADKLLMG
jgi:predicted AAA+ superfamily ATPase